MTTSPLSADEYCAQARACLAAKDIPAAIAHYEQAIEFYPDHVTAFESLAAVCFARKENARAVELFKRVVALNPQKVDALVNLGAAYNRIGNFQEAIRSLRHALARDRKCAAAYYNLGFAERSHGQLSMAVSAFKEAIRLNPEMWEAYINLGQTLLAMKSPAQAAPHFERALQIRPESRTAREGLIAARNAVDLAKHAISPFGRLVNMDEIEKRNAQENQHTTAMTAEERMHDRQTAHQLAQEIQQSSTVLLNTIRDELLPAIQALAHHLNESDPRNWCPHFELLMQSKSRFLHIMSIVNSRTSALQAHEEAVQRRAGEERQASN